MNQEKSFIDFLEDIAANIFASDVQKLCFRLRFHPDNQKLEHVDIAKLMKKDKQLNGGFSETSINPTVQEVIKKIKDKFSTEMEADGIDIAKLTPGRGKPKESPWKMVYNWLWNQQFPRWRLQWIWQNLLEKADKHSQWMDFIHQMDFQKGVVVPPPRQKTQQEIQVDAPYLMRIDLPHSERNLLLINRGITTKYILSPSQAFAPKCQLNGNPIWMPQDGAMCEEIKFDSPGKEEFLGIVVDGSWDFDWLIPSEYEPAPVWDEERIYQLWSYLEKQGNWQAFYQALEVV